MQNFQQLFKQVVFNLFTSLVSAFYEKFGPWFSLTRIINLSLWFIGFYILCLYTKKSIKKYITLTKCLYEDLL